MSDGTVDPIDRPASSVSARARSGAAAGDAPQSDDRARRGAGRDRGRVPARAPRSARRRRDGQHPDRRSHPPRLVDLVAALATGTVGAFALSRSDVSDALPGVAIAISLVPPLAVAGVLLEATRFADAVGPILLFATNATAIVATGTGVFLAYRVRHAAEAAGVPVGDLRGRTLAAVVGLVAVVAAPLGVGSASLVRDHRLQLTATPIATRRAEDQGWQVVRVRATDGALEIVGSGHRR